MAPERRKLLLLALIVVVLAFALAAIFRADTAAPAPADTAAGGARASNGKGRGAAGPQTITAPDVHLDALNAEHARPADNDRNLFRFQPKAPPPRVTAVPPIRPVQPPPLAPPGPPPAPATPPISLKFVGSVQKTEGGERIASLSLNDGRGIVLGREGDIVLGRYKIWRIGEESVEVSYVDGTGRTTIRLSGQ